MTDELKPIIVAPTRRIIDEDGVILKLHPDGSLQTTSVNTGVVDPVNSSSTPLIANDTFTGVALDVLDFAEARIAVYSNVASATDGLCIEYSSDGVSWRHSDAYTVPASTGKNYSVQRLAQYFRIVYVNGSINQTVFDLQVIHNRIYTRSSSHRIQDPISTDDDATLVKSVMTGEDETGIYQNIRSNSDGLLLTGDFFVEAAKGNIPGHTVEQKFGENPDIRGVSESMWDAGGLYPWSTWDASGAVTLDIQSDDAADDLVGTGAQTVQIYGLDSSWDEQEETIELDGTTPVTTVGSYVRLHRMVVLTAGTGNTTAGTITAVNGVTVIAQIDNGNNQTLMTVFTVPLGKTAYLLYGKASVGKSGDLSGQFFIRPFGGVFNVKHTFQIFQTTYDYQFKAVPKVPEKSDFDVRAVTSVPSGVKATASFDLILVDNVIPPVFITNTRIDSNGDTRVDSLGNTRVTKEVS